MCLCITHLDVDVNILFFASVDSRRVILDLYLSLGSGTSVPETKIKTSSECKHTPN